jgi:organic radical activating enzyme
MKITTSELFYSPQGEGPLTGRPQVWARVAKCNFQCQGFNNPKNVDTTTNEGLGFDPTEYKTLQELPPISVGCDSIYSWDDRFKHMWTTWTLEELANALLEQTPEGKWTRNIGLTLTGGEPTSRMKAIVELMKLPKFNDLMWLTFETNCSVPLMDKHMADLWNWKLRKPGRQLVWSNSPKLRYTGEPWEKAINPAVAAQQRKTGGYQYFKFVVEPTKESFDEVEEAMAAYYEGGTPEETEIWIMPVGGLLEQQQEVDRWITEETSRRGWNTSLRAHIYVFGNEIGT